MRNRYINITIITILTIIIINNFTSVYSISSFKELEDIKKVTETNNIEIQKWKVYIKDTKSNVPLRVVKNELRDIFKKEDGYSWDKEVDEHHYQATGVMEKGNIIEKVIISVLPSNHEYSITYTYQLIVEGSIGNDVLNQLNIPFDFKKNNRFLTVEGVTYEGESNNSISKDLLDLVDGKKVEELNEKGFLSVSGYTSNWETQLKLDEQNIMNIQIGVRKLSDQTSKITIGTPIIITEY